MLAEGRSTDIAKGGPSTAYCGRAHKAPHGTRLKSWPTFEVHQSFPVKTGAMVTSFNKSEQTYSVAEKPHSLCSLSTGSLTACRAISFTSFGQRTL